MAGGGGGWEVLSRYRRSSFCSNVVRYVNFTTGLISTVAGSSGAGFSGDGGPATLAQLNAPLGVLADGAGGVLITDTGNNVVRWALANGTIRTVAGNTSTAVYSGDGGPATLAWYALEGVVDAAACPLLTASLARSLFGPTALLADGAGGYFVTDTLVRSSSCCLPTCAVAHFTITCCRRTTSFGALRSAVTSVWCKACRGYLA